MVAVLPQRKTVAFRPCQEEPSSDSVVPTNVRIAAELRAPVSSTTVPATAFDVRRPPFGLRSTNTSAVRSLVFGALAEAINASRARLFVYSAEMPTTPRTSVRYEFPTSTFCLLLLICFCVEKEVPSRIINCGVEFPNLCSTNFGTCNHPLLVFRGDFSTWGVRLASLCSKRRGRG